MIIEINTPETKEYYDEVLYIYANHHRYTKEAKTGTILLSQHYRKYALYSFLAVALFCVFYYVFDSLIFVIMSGMALLLALLAINNLIRTRRSIENMIASFRPHAIELNEEGVSYSSPNMMLHVAWHDISRIVLSRRSIVFIHAGSDTSLISVSSSHRKEVETALQEYQHEDLLTDASSL